MRPLIEAAEAFPAFETEVVRAEAEIFFGMRLFEADLPLATVAAKAEGARTWAELLAQKAAAGVQVRILLSDFQPEIATKLHEDAWRSVEGFLKAADAAGAGDNLSIMASLHPGEIGRIARLALWPVVRLRLGDLRKRIDAGYDTDLTPGLWNSLRRRGAEVRVKLMPKFRLRPATHHQKMATFDGVRAIVGGIDLARRMYDTPDHDRPSEQTWHDVSLYVEGPLAATARRHLRQVWNASAPGFNARVTAMGAPRANLLQPVAPIPAAPKAPPMDPDFRRTLSRHSRSGFAMGPKPKITEIEDALLTEIGKAERLIYLETQFFRSPVIAKALAAAGRARPDLRLILLLPGAPEDVAFEGNRDADARQGEWLQVRAVDRINAAFGDRFGVYSLAKPEVDPGRNASPRASLMGAPIVYVHAKTSIFDSATAIVGSANLNGRSLKWDTETAVCWRDADGVGAFQAKLWGRHFANDPPASADGLDGWRARATANAALPPDQRQGFILPYDREAARAYAERRFWVPTNLL